MNELEHLSYSSISAYLACARAWKFKYIEKLPTYSTPELVLGNAIHNAVEQYVQQKEKAVTDYWQAAWNKATEGQQIVWGADMPEMHFNEGLRILSNEQIQYNLATIHPGIDDLGYKVERKVELLVPSVPIPIIGYIDIQTQDGVPGDIKTSARSWTQERAQSETQSLFYLAALNQMGKTVEGWRFRHYIIVKTKTPQFQIYEHSHKASEIFWLFGMIKMVWKGIKKEVFPENTGSWKCSPAYCDFYAHCRGRYL